MREKKSSKTYSITQHNCCRSPDGLCFPASLCRAGGEGKSRWVGFHEQILGCSWTSLISNASQGQGCWGR